MIRRGGVWVSLRDRDEIYQRYARDGFWTFPGEAAPAAPEEVMRAARQTAKSLGDDPAEARRILERSSIAVTFFPGAGKVPSLVNSITTGTASWCAAANGRAQMGGALPRMPGIGNE